MSDLISRKALHRDIYIRVSQMLQDITDAPAIEAEPVRHGRWIKEELVGCDPYYLCSMCGKLHYHTYNFCNNCGAKMDGGMDNGKAD